MPHFPSDVVNPAAQIVACKLAGSSAGSHTLTYTLHLEEMEGQEGGADDERGGRRSCSALGEREAQSSGSEGTWKEKERNIRSLHLQRPPLILAYWDLTFRLRFASLGGKDQVCVCVCLGGGVWGWC